MRHGFLLLLVATACTDAHLYGKDYVPNQANRISFEGNLCTDDPGAIAFPQKTLIVMDGTGALAEADPAGKRVAALKAFIGRIGIRLQTSPGSPVKLPAEHRPSGSDNRQ